MSVCCSNSNINDKQMETNEIDSASKLVSQMTEMSYSTHIVGLIVYGKCQSMP